METGTPEFARKPKAGLLRALPAAGQAGRGTQAPGEGFALTIAARECAKLKFEHEHDRSDVTLGVALVAAKRASLIGRGPQLSDVKAALNMFGLLDVALVDQELSHPFRGLAHSYVLQRRFVDAVDGDELVATGSERLF
jgi:hypothetical protein